MMVNGRMADVLDEAAFLLKMGIVCLVPLFKTKLKGK